MTSELRNLAPKPAPGKATESPRIVRCADCMYFQPTGTIPAFYGGETKRHGTEGECRKRAPVATIGGKTMYASAVALFEPGLQSVPHPDYPNRPLARGECGLLDGWCGEGWPR